MSYLRRAGHWTWQAFVLGVLLLTLVVVLVRGLAPQVSQWRPSLEAVASQALGQPLRLGDIRARINGWHPSIEATGVELLDESGQYVALRADTLRLEIDILQSLRELALQTGLIEIVGAQFSVQRDETGRVLLSGFTPAGVSKNNTAVGEWVFSQPRLRLLETDLYWQDYQLDNRTLFFQDVSLDLQNDADRHQLAADLTLPAPWGGPLSVRMDMQGSVLQPKGRKTKMYLAASGLYLPFILSELMASPVAISDGEAALEIWTNWADGHIASAQGQFDIEGWPKRAGRTGYTGNFRAAFSADQWRIDLLEAGSSADPFHAAMRYSWQDQPVSAKLQLASSSLPVGALRELAPGVLPSAANDLLEDWRLDGQVKDLQLQVHARSPVDIDWGFYAKVDGLQADASGHLPGFSELGGEVWVNADGGVLRMASAQRSRLSLPKLFKAPLSLRFSDDSELYWRFSKTGSMALSAPKLDLTVNDIGLQSRLFMLWPTEGAPLLDLQAELAGADVQAAQSLLPNKIMHPGLVKWLGYGPADGEIRSATALWRGPLDKLPFANAQGSFRVVGEVEKAKIQFQPNWKPIENGTAKLAFDDQSMLIELSEGTLGGHKIDFAKASLARMKPISPLVIKGRTHGAVSDGLALLNASPIGKLIPEPLRNAKTEGKAKVDLSLTVPLRKKRGEIQVQVQGKADVENASLELPDSNTELTDLNGPVHFTHKSIGAEALAGRWRDIPMLASFEHLFSSKQHFDIDVGGKLTAQHLRSLAGAAAKPLRGEADWQGKVSIPVNSTQTATISVQSNFVGMEIQAPEPMQKPKLAEISISGELRTVDDDSRTLMLKFGNYAEYHSELEARGEAWEPVAQHLRFGGTPKAVPQKGLLISGALGRVPLDDWIAFMVNIGSNGSAGDNAGTQLDVQIDQLETLNDQFPDVHLKGRADSKQLAFRFDSERLAGGVDFGWASDSSRPLSIDLSRLDFSKPELERDADGLNWRSYSALNPADLPALAVDVEKLSIGGLALGKLGLRTLRVKDGLQMTSARIVGPYTDLNASGDWLLRGGTPRSRFYVNLKTENIGQLLQRFGFERTIAEGQGRLLIDGKANVALPDVQLSDVDGTFSINLEKGRLPKVNPGVGRVFSLLDLGSIQRRLSLDFSDVVDKGMAFESIQGHFTLSQGDAYTNDLSLRGPAADIDINGRIGLLARDYQQRIIVKPNLAMTVPIAGTVVGGPAVGAALLVVQELIGGPAKEISKVEYELTGSWDAPQVVKGRQPQAEQDAEDLDIFEE